MSTKIFNPLSCTSTTVPQYRNVFAFLSAGVSYSPTTKMKTPAPGRRRNPFPGTRTVVWIGNKAGCIKGLMSFRLGAMIDWGLVKGVIILEKMGLLPGSEGISKGTIGVGWIGGGSTAWYASSAPLVIGVGGIKNDSWSFLSSSTTVWGMKKWYSGCGWLLGFSGFMV